MCVCDIRIVFFLIANLCNIIAFEVFVYGNVNISTDELIKIVAPLEKVHIFYVDLKLKVLNIFLLNF